MAYNQTQSTIFINDQNNTSTNPSQILLKFANGLRLDNSWEIALSSLFINYSWPNVYQAYYNNNSFSISYNGVTYPITLPNGYYSVDDLNQYIQQVLFTNGIYLVDGSGNIVPMWSIVNNPVYYANTITAPYYASNPAGYGTAGVNVVFPSYPIQLNILNNNFGNLIGFSPASYPASATLTTTYQRNSVITPEISPVISVSLNCSLVSSGILNTSNNGTSIFQFGPNNIAYGAQIQPPIYQYQWFPVVSNYYDQMVLQFTDQQGLPLPILDTAITLTLTLKKLQRFP